MPSEAGGSVCCSFQRAENVLDSTLGATRSSSGRPGGLGLMVDRASSITIRDPKLVFVCLPGYGDDKGEEECISGWKGSGDLDSDGTLSRENGMDVWLVWTL